MTLRKSAIILSVAVFAALAVEAVFAVMLCVETLHPRHKPIRAERRAVIERDVRDVSAKMEEVETASFDNTRLRAWFFRPHEGNGKVVIVLHGHGDNRAGPAGFAAMFLRRHYAVLAPDARAHGESEGDFATFGLYEARDLSRWVDWLAGQSYHGCVYGLGESMGASILLQALPTEHRFCAAAAESPYASFREIGYTRLDQRVGDGWLIHDLVVVPLVSEGFVYARLRYGVNLDEVSAARQVAATRIPILLIHGMEDFNIPIRHCWEIMQNHAGPMELWEVPGAGHTKAYAVEPEEFEQRVTDWFDLHTVRE